MLRDVLEYKRSSSLNELEEPKLDISAVALETVWEALAVATLFSNIHNTCFVLAARFSLKLKVSFLCFSKGLLSLVSSSSGRSTVLFFQRGYQVLSNLEVQILLLE